MERMMDLQDAVMLVLFTVPTWVVAVAAFITLLFTGA
jgi:hypothetical protein